MLVEVMRALVLCVACGRRTREEVFRDGAAERGVNCYDSGDPDEVHSFILTRDCAVCRTHRDDTVVLLNDKEEVVNIVWRLSRYLQAVAKAFARFKGCEERQNDGSVENVCREWINELSVSEALQRVGYYPIRVPFVWKDCVRKMFFVPCVVGGGSVEVGDDFVDLDGDEEERCLEECGG